MNTGATTNVEEYYRPMQHVREYDVSDLPTLIRVSVIILVIACKVQLSVQFSVLLICTVYKS